MNKAEDQIRRAIEDGKFDNLPGKGKPLRLVRDPFEDPEWRMANHVLRNAGFSLPWIETRREIEGSLQEARGSLARSWNWRQVASQQVDSWLLVEAEWQRAEETFRRQIAELNRRILSLNLEVPNDRFQMPLLNIERELNTIQSKTDESYL